MTRSHGMSFNMKFEKGKYYHLYNRTNNHEPLFQETENHDFLLTKFFQHLSPFISVVAYCLMPTHFHFLIRVETDESLSVSNNIAIVLRSYTRAINKRYNREGNLFQQNTKAKEITDNQYLITLISYIHQNPIRAKLVSHLDDWTYSSYKILCEDSDDESVGKSIIKLHFKSADEFKRYSNEIIDSVRKEFWI